MQPAKVSILLLVRSFEVGGAERQLVELARGLHSRGHRVAVAAFYHRGPLDQQLRDAGIPILDLEKKGRWEVLRFLRRLRRAVPEFRPDVLYCFGTGPDIVAAGLKPFLGRTRLIWSIRASDLDLSRYDWTQRLSYRAERLLSAAPDLIIANSEAGREYAAAKGFPRSRMEVVPNGTDVARFRPDPDLRGRQRANWGISDSTIVVGVLARLDPMKGQSDFIEAAARLARQRPDIHFFCVGLGPEEQRLTALADGLGLDNAIAFTGRTDEPEAVLNGFDIYCSPSISEGFPNAIAEAMACGVACVVTNVGDSARIVGDTGLVVPRFDPEALAGAILQLIGSDRKELGARARQRIVENFSVDAMVEATLRLIAPSHSRNSTGT